jgi:hypothetical protein
MTGKKTYLYKAEMKNGSGETVKTAYFYGRNASVVKQFCQENYRPLVNYTNIDLTKVGESKITVIEPVVEFNNEETAQIEQYFMREMVKYVYFQNKFGGSPTENV